MNPRRRSLSKGLAGFRANYTGRPVPIADMGRVMFFDDLFLKSETDIAFLNSFGMKGAYDGVDLFPPREAALIRSMAPARVRVLGCVDPPDGQSAVESLIYQCETLKIDGLKLYPPGMDARGWLMDDEKNTYPLYEVLRKHGVKNVCVHKGIPGAFIEKYCHPLDMTRAAADFPDLNFIAFHSAYPVRRGVGRASEESESEKHLRRAWRACAIDGERSAEIRSTRRTAARWAGCGSHFLGNGHADLRASALGDPGVSGVHDSR